MIDASHLTRVEHGTVYDCFCCVGNICIVKYLKTRTKFPGMKINGQGNVTMAGALPPNSRTQGLRCLAASIAIILPTRSLPVNWQDMHQIAIGYS